MSELRNAFEDDALEFVLKDNRSVTDTEAGPEQDDLAGSVGVGRRLLLLRQLAALADDVLVDLLGLRHADLAEPDHPLRDELHVGGGHAHADRDAPRVERHVALLDALRAERQTGGEVLAETDRREKLGELLGVAHAADPPQELDAGMILELYRLGARGILVAGCQTKRCRFGSGALVAQTEVERARAILGLIGGDTHRIACDWSEGRAQDPLDASVKDLLAGEIA